MSDHKHNTPSMILDVSCLHAHTVLFNVLLLAINKPRLDKMKRISCSWLRNFIAIYLLNHIYDIRTIQELLGHKIFNTNM